MQAGNQADIVFDKIILFFLSCNLYNCNFLVSFFCWLSFFLFLTVHLSCQSHQWVWQNFFCKKPAPQHSSLQHMQLQNTKASRWIWQQYPHLDHSFCHIHTSWELMNLDPFWAILRSMGTQGRCLVGGEKGVRYLRKLLLYPLWGTRGYLQTQQGALSCCTGLIHWPSYTFKLT